MKATARRMVNFRRTLMIKNGLTGNRNAGTANPDFGTANRDFGMLDLTQPCRRGAAHDTNGRRLDDPMTCNHRPQCLMPGRVDQPRQTLELRFHFVGCGERTCDRVAVEEKRVLPS